MFQARRKRESGKGKEKKFDDRKGKKRSHRCMNEFVDVDYDQDDDEGNVGDNQQEKSTSSASSPVFLYQYNATEDQKHHHSSPYIHVKTEEV